MQLLRALLIASVLLSVDAAEIDMDGSVLIEFTELLPPDFVIARQSSNSIAVADFEQSNEPSPELRIQLHNIYRVVASDRPCTLAESVRRDAVNSSVTALKRLNDDRVVIVWHDELLQADADRRSTIVVVHLESCIVINRDMSRLRGKPIVVTTADGNFDVFVNDRAACGSAQCAIRYDLKLDEYSRPRPFDVDLDWPNLEVDPSPDPNYLVIRGFKDSVYKVLLMNRSSGHTKALMSILAVNPRLEFFSAALSFCWTMPSADISVRCAQFDTRGELIFSTTMQLDHARKVTLIHVRDMGKGKIFLIAGVVACSAKYDCWNLTVAQVFQDHTLRSESSTFRCTGDRKRLAVLDVSAKANASIIRYSCRYENGYAYDKNVVQWKLFSGKNLVPSCQRYAGDTQLFC